MKWVEQMEKLGTLQRAVEERQALKMRVRHLEARLAAADRIIKAGLMWLHDPLRTKCAGSGVILDMTDAERRLGLLLYDYERATAEKEGGP